MKRAVIYLCPLWYYTAAMRYALLADIHANLDAFTAVLDDIQRKGGVDEIWCMGDIVGYGPYPTECIALLRKQRHICVVGNHDLAAIGKLGLGRFNPDAAAVNRWTAQQLSDEDKQYLEGLPQVIEKGEFTIVHGSPREPIWEYVISKGVAGENFSYFKSKFCLAGHSHIPQIFRLMPEVGCTYIQFRESIGEVFGSDRMIVNPGAVGQPRDGGPQSQLCHL